VPCHNLDKCRPTSITPVISAFKMPTDKAKIKSRIIIKPQMRFQLRRKAHKTVNYMCTLHMTPIFDETRHVSVCVITLLHSIFIVELGVKMSHPVYIRDCTYCKLLVLDRVRHFRPIPIHRFFAVN